MKQSLLNCVIERIKHIFVGLETYFDDINDIIDKAQHFGDIFAIV